MSTEPLHTVAELAARWRVSKMTVHRLVDDGTLPALRIGRSIRIPRSAALAYEAGKPIPRTLPTP